MSDIKNYHSEEHSLSNGQVLMRNYSFDEALEINKKIIQEKQGKDKPERGADFGVR